jgi:hypothetical protein
MGEKDRPVSARRDLQRGQSLVLVALMMIVFIGMLAVVLDGGYAFMQKRKAQTAADAGAMAGARELCLTGDVNLATLAAADYSITRNRALEADITIVDGEVTVTARIPFSTFFGGLLGQPSITSSAIAASNCFPPARATGVLPVAWHCPIEDIKLDSDGDKYCDFQLYDGVGPVEKSELYIIMNSRKVGEEDDPFCMSEGPVDCDLDGDGDEEMLVGGDRSWLDLSGGGGGASELVDWIQNGFPDGVEMHTWFAGQSGVANSIFLSVPIGVQVVLPVYDAISVGLPVFPQLHAGDKIVATSGTWTNYFHLISFSIFVPTCVHATGGDHCPLYDDYRAEGYLGPDDKTIEGYFVKGFAGGLGGEGELDAGAYTLYLTR